MKKFKISYLVLVTQDVDADDESTFTDIEQYALEKCIEARENGDSLTIHSIEEVVVDE